ncbi:hypothetical protein GCM10010320_49670 [Streptomyces caelestis]|uniref:Uncharacterized protein n=1 Tax=Streptomyces caelestis TaxID=36816 RepID=A0A7W9LRD0_9ACTN|nr:hypothetical protein [Streptomyces caelestis]GGW62665.1 hypothetical protein GCM10010320_49670 [Streptomyces caelestis]
MPRTHLRFGKDRTVATELQDVRARRERTGRQDRQEQTGRAPDGRRGAPGYSHRTVRATRVTTAA